VKNLSVLVPFFNEEKTLFKSISNLISANVSNEIILINDNSTDNSLKIAEELVSKNECVELINSDKNLGKGNAISLGLKKVNSDFVIVHDADLEYNPVDIKKILESIPKMQNTNTVVLGSRFIGDINRENIYLRTYLANKLFSFLFSLFNNFKVSDVATCYKLISRDIYKNIEIEKNGFDFEIEILHKALEHCKYYKEVPISYSGRSYEDGKKIKLVDGFRYLKAILIDYNKRS
jgi:glycosyltransferase involved in cell wall biosynthesis